MKMRVVILIMLAAAYLDAQEPKPRFDVASFKHNVAGAQGFGGQATRAGATPTGFTATNATLLEVIRTAYEFEDDRLQQFDDRILNVTRPKDPLERMSSCRDRRTALGRRLPHRARRRNR